MNKIKLNSSMFDYLKSFKLVRFFQIFPDFSTNLSTAIKNYKVINNLKLGKCYRNV